MSVDDATRVGKFAVDLFSAAIPEWEVADELIGHLADEPVLADDERARQLLDAVRFELPVVVGHQRLTGGTERDSPFGPLDVDSSDSDFHLVEVPLDILLPHKERLVRVRMRLELGSDAAEPVVTHDLYPQNTWLDEIHDLGEVTLDLSKALTFVCPGVAECLGLNLRLPIRWRSKMTTISATGRATNHAEWAVEDEEIGTGFVGYAVVRSPRDRRVTVDVELACEIRHRGPLGFVKARAVSRKHRYELPTSR